MIRGPRRPEWNRSPEQSMPVLAAVLAVALAVWLVWSREGATRTRANVPAVPVTSNAPTGAK